MTRSTCTPQPAACPACPPPPARRPDVPCPACSNSNATRVPSREKNDKRAPPPPPPSQQPTPMPPCSNSNATLPRLPADEVAAPPAPLPPKSQTDKKEKLPPNAHSFMRAAQRTALQGEPVVVNGRACTRDAAQCTFRDFVSHDALQRKLATCKCDGCDGPCGADAYAAHNDLTQVTSGHRRPCCVADFFFCFFPQHLTVALRLFFFFASCSRIWTTAATPSTSCCAGSAAPASTTQASR